MSTYLHKSAGESETFDLTERHIYGSSRLGLYKEPVSMLAVGGPPAFQYDIPGYRHYELSNHLGNVTTIITGQKLPILSGSTLTGYKPQIVQSMDYSPFGVTRLSFDVTAMSTTDPVGDGYRYGFNGMEKDDEVKGSGVINFQIDDMFESVEGVQLKLAEAIARLEGRVARMEGR
jgi:hypothetical protein